MMIRFAKTPWALFLIVGFLNGVSAGALASASTPLQERMSDEQFRAAGLHKLSADELARLNAFLSQEPPIAEKRAGETQAAEAPQTGSRTPPQAADDNQSEPPDDVGFEQKTEREAFTAQIDGEFNGWNGKTRFRLKNGQVWQQTQGGTFYYPGDPEPKVMFEPGMFGTWFMRVEGYGSRARVKRIR